MDWNLLIECFSVLSGISIITNAVIALAKMRHARAREESLERYDRALILSPQDPRLEIADMQLALEAITSAATSRGTPKAKVGKVTVELLERGRITQDQAHAILRGMRDQKQSFSEWLLE